MFFFLKNNIILFGSCVVWDCGSRNNHRYSGLSRAQFLGLEFTRFVLNRLWFDRDDFKSYASGVQCTNTHWESLKKFPKSVLR